jgi:hypothetical protein
MFARFFALPVLSLTPNRQHWAEHFLHHVRPDRGTVQPCPQGDWCEYLEYACYPSHNENKSDFSFTVPSLVFFFGLVCIATAFIKDFAGFMCVRVFLGLAEGGMMPGVAYYLSMWYKRHELAMRIGIFGELHL